LEKPFIAAASATKQLSSRRITCKPDASQEVRHVFAPTSGCQEKTRGLKARALVGAHWFDLDLLLRT
jgi:hypothetical protein